MLTGLLVAVLVAAAIVWRNALVARVTAFGRETGPALDLAVFRVLFFAAMVHYDPFRLVDEYARLDPAFRVAPDGLGWTTSWFPMQAGLVGAALVVVRVSAITALVGFFTRTSAIVFASAATYLLVIPNFFGKVDHNHHLVWFALILGLAPSGAVLSVDAIRRSYRTATVEAVPARPERRFALPLRLIWLLIGVIYLFPGIGKLRSGGLNWALSDNVRDQLRVQWTTNGIEPFLRVDEWIPAYWAIGLVTLGFEIGFVALVLFRRTRPIAAVSGLAFHNGTWLLMGIRFVTLQVAYLSFVPWSRALRAVGRILPSIDVVIDDEAGEGARILAAVRSVDVFDRIRLVDDRDSGTPPLLRTSDLRLVSPGARRVLAAAPLGAFVVAILPLLRGFPPRASSGHRGRVGPRPVLLGGGAILAAAVVTGATQTTSAWPVAGYPIFPAYAASHVNVPVITVVAADGATETITLDEGGTWLSSHRFLSLVRITVVEPDVDLREERAAALLRTIPLLGLEGIGDVDRIDIDLDRLAVDPDRWSTNPVETRAYATVTDEEVAFASPDTDSAPGVARDVDD